MTQNQKFLTEQVPELLSRLKADDEPSFGIMTAQHMVEHLIYVTKSSVKDYGPAPEIIPDRALGFMRFIDNGANFEYRPSDKKRSDLDPPRMSDLASAIAVIPEAINRLYSNDREREFYNPLMGKLSFDQMELFHAQHFRHHLIDQFKLASAE